MTLLRTSDWEITAGVAAIALLGVAAIWLLRRRRPTAGELERARREFLVQSGRLVDGMFLDVYEVDAEDGRSLTMLLYSYRIAGVDYECSQDISALRNLVDVPRIRAGFPCSVRYQPGNAQNSIVLAEAWSGLRAGLPLLHARDDSDSLHLS